MKSKKYGYIKIYSDWWLVFIGLTALVVICGQIYALERENRPDVIFAHFEHKNPVQVKFESIEAIVTAYSADIEQTDERPWEMASGRTVYDGAIACPIMLNFGDKVEIGGNIYTCEDRMAKRYRDKWRFDILMKDKQSALRWGKQTKQVIY